MLICTFLTSSWSLRVWSSWPKKSSLQPSWKNTSSSAGCVPFRVCLAILSIPESWSYSLSCSSGGKGGPLHRASTVASQKLPGSDAGGHVRPHLSPWSTGAGWPTSDCRSIFPSKNFLFRLCSAMRGHCLVVQQISQWLVNPRTEGVPDCAARMNLLKEISV